MASSAASTTTSVREVDYYLNPTELFRWINYRRWDGAKSRAQSHPDECCTWIVSRHNTDGRILWRHLPLHLICMQKEAACGVLDESDVQAVVASRQMEQLMDVLLDSYPEGASSPDDQGMLPLHLLLSKAEGEPNERVINLLLSSFPNAVDIRDKFGRTPHDILRESCGGTAGVDGAPDDGTSDRCRAAFRALKRARFVADRITSTIRDESANIVAAVQHEASNERGASQKIIVRLEEELNNTRGEMEVRDSRERDVHENIRRMKSELAMMESKVADAGRNLDVTRRERDELLTKNETMKVQLDSHNEIVERVRREAGKSREGNQEVISKLKSEVSTSKAMSEALESQLRSRFTNEEYLTTTVADLEEQLDELKVRHDHATKKNMHEMESITANNKKLKWNAEELSKKNTQLQDKLKDLNKQMSQIISSYSTLNTEHDRLLELAQTYESSLLDTVRSERAQLVEHYNKQRETLEKSFIEQERVIEESLQNQDRLMTTAKADRTRGKGAVDKLRNEFQQLRAAAAERERTIHVEELAASRKMKRVTARKGDSESIASSSPGESRNPHPSHSHHRAPPPRVMIHSSPSSSAADGHLVRLLDERAAAQSTPRRGELGVSLSSSGTDSSAQPQYYKHHQQYPGNGKHPLPSPMRRDMPVQGGRGGGGVTLSKSISATSTYPGRGPGIGSGGGDYSLDQYSHDSSETSGTTGRYSECSSQYSKEDPRRSSMDPPHSPPGGRQQHHPQQQQQWTQQEY
mmetsp:Transcript_12917/g.22738  ORF Transcript_12917/g.22738 Transcript_12917/m.22738 type:complete len:752 (-) Transcript_12917:150-2405(-)|eukprot:CAMPEP_0201917294 /NCGR_PEP_ID=MMETSP0903-20130614/6702_1 /ASSEMBLY_ACC=CAM_ASM_000552 /TAXON_ID=420261 /ORGANISM="Thalassiosira antarctica, Strain CCMP982" /LENGTH=751 /DNA_ID=CAMNT_0048453317 /DNA_START=45 /DNA_END=2300 /DNA_ORIENTATION=+